MLLSPEIRARRVSIARDILKQLEARALTLARGTYMSPVDYDAKQRLSVQLEGDLQEHANLFQANCEVCMIGAIFLSKARVLNNVSMKDNFKCDWGSLRLPGRYGMMRAVSDVFDAKTMALAEAAFECTIHNANLGEASPEEFYGAALFGHYAGQYDGRPEDLRCEAVAKNLIQNEGELRLGFATYQEWLER